MDFGYILLAIAIIALAGFVYRAGSAMNSLEQRVSDMQDKLAQIDKS